MTQEKEATGPRIVGNGKNVVITTTMTATFIALVFLLTYPFSSLFPVPSTQGYYDPGDIMIFIASLTFGPVVGGFSGAFGSAFSDALGGFGTFAPFTFMIKGLEGLLVGLIVKRSLTIRTQLIAWAVGGLTLVAGYFLAESYFIAWVFGNSPYTGVVAATAEVPINILQAVGAGLVGIPASSALRKALISSAYYPRLFGSKKSAAQNPKK